MPYIMWTNDLEIWRVGLCHLDQTGNLKDECTCNFHTSIKLKQDNSLRNTGKDTTAYNDLVFTYAIY